MSIPRRPFLLLFILWAGIFKASGSSDGHAYEASPPPQPTPPTTSTTTTERIPLPFENPTNELIRQNHNAIDLLQVNLARYDTQLNLNALNTLLPKLKLLRQNMSDLLISPPPNPYAFENQTNVLEEKLSEVELQIQQNRALLERQEVIQQDSKKQLEILQQSLGTILLSQVGILSDEPLSTVPGAVSASGRLLTRTEILNRIDTILASFTVSENFAQELQNFLEGFTTPEDRLFAYNQTMFSLTAEHKQMKTTLLVQLAKSIFKFPELSELKVLLPDRVKNVFTEELKVLEMRSSSRRVVINVHGNVIARSGSSAGVSRLWKFPSLDNGEYFAIVHATMNKALGVVRSTSASGDNLYKSVVKSFTNEDSVKDDHFYQWKILAFNADSYFLRFINRQTGFALDTDSNYGITVMPVSDGNSQDWELN